MNGSEERKPFAVHRAAADLLQVFLDGRCYDTLNPYSRKEFKSALVALGQSCGVQNWMDTDAILSAAPAHGPVHEGACRLVRLFIQGDNYDQKNPYSRPEVADLLKALANDTGVADPLNTDAIFQRVNDPALVLMERAKAARRGAIYDARVLQGDIAFLTARLKCRASTIGVWEPIDGQDAITIGLGLPDTGGADGLREVGFFAVHFQPGSDSVTKIEAVRVDTAESLLLDENPQTRPTMGI